MISKKHRVTKDTFRVVMREGKTFSTQLFSFYFKESKVSKYAFVAPKSIFKTAVERNKFRRIGYNILRFIPTKPGCGVFIYKKQAILSRPQEIKENILFIFKKTGFL